MLLAKSHTTLIMLLSLNIQVNTTQFFVNSINIVDIFIFLLVKKVRPTVETILIEDHNKQNKIRHGSCRRIARTYKSNFEIKENINSNELWMLSNDFFYLLHSLFHLYKTYLKRLYCVCIVFMKDFDKVWRDELLVNNINCKTCSVILKSMCKSHTWLTAIWLWHMLCIVCPEWRSLYISKILFVCGLRNISMNLISLNMPFQN